MKILGLFLVFISFQLQAVELKTLWWNIGANAYSDDLGMYTTLDETLLVKDFSQFDVIAFGEYKDNKLYPQGIKKIESMFPYRIKFKYNKTSKQRIYLFSKYPVDTMKSYIMDWVPGSMNDDQKKKYKERMRKKLGKRVNNFIRTYNRVTLRVNNKKINFIFYHLNNPWPGYIESSGRVGAGAELILGKRNPLMYQLTNFQRIIKHDLGKDYLKKPIIMMGDSNCATRVKGIATACIKRMERIMPLVMDHARMYTFPADTWSGAGNYPKVKIDQAQSNIHSNDLELKVLEWNGSDHYPITLKTNLN